MIARLACGTAPAGSAGRRSHCRRCRAHRCRRWSGHARHSPPAPSRGRPGARRHRAAGPAFRAPGRSR